MINKEYLDYIYEIRTVVVSQMSTLKKKDQFPMNDCGESHAENNCSLEIVHLIFQLQNIDNLIEKYLEVSNGN